MFVGHFAVGFIGKRVEPKLSLGTLVLASMLADLLWVVFLIAGIETVQIKPGRGAANYFDTAASDIAWSHSLVMVFVWALLFAAAYYFAGRRYVRGAWVLFVVVLSHWFLDFVSLKNPLAPGVHEFLGLGLWLSIPATIIVEGGLWAIALGLYLRATYPRNRLAVFVFWSVTALLTLSWYNNITGPPPPSAMVAGISGLIFFSLAVAWAYWMNRLRRSVT